MGLIKRMFGSFSEKEIEKMQPILNKIDGLEDEYRSLTDSELRGKTDLFKDRLSKGETLDDILPEAFATVREASDRVLGMRHYRVQMIGGIVLHRGQISEMKTGEGKTLVATLPAYLNALEGKGVHIVTVNDYLAQRDMEWMGKVYKFLGLSVGCIIYGLTNDERKRNYACDITYGTNNQFGFDYLRDNMVIYKKDLVQRGLHYAIIDEVDSILIDEARTPLIISGQGDESTEMYERANTFVHTLTGRILDPNEDENDDPFDREFKVETVDYIVDEKRKSSNLTEQGTRAAEKYFGIDNLSNPENMELAHHINQALKANYTMHRDVDYVVKDGEILIVDEFTGRIMQGRRYSEGLHQAIEAKEGVEIKSESKTLATITFQNYFRMYDKIAGMTGTAKTEEGEFNEIYNLDVVEIPTNKEVKRVDYNDRVYVNENAKYKAIIDEIKSVYETGQPILVGTISIEHSELISKMLKREKIPHDVLNAKQHEREAEIVAQAGRLGTVTIATNMAGRGTDIVLGGNPEFMAKKEMRKRGYTEEIIEQVDSFADTDDEEILEARKVYNDLKAEFKEETDQNAQEVVAAGGLYIIGTERHESRRIDNQLRGRSGRQGDPGASRFFVSLEDDLMRLFGGERIQDMAETGDFPEDEPIEAKMVTSAIERAQKKVESNNFAVRKRVLEYDNVMNKQREVIYGERRRVLDGEDMHDFILDMIKDLVDSAVDTFCAKDVKSDHWEIEGLINYLSSIGMGEDLISLPEKSGISQESLKESLEDQALSLYKEKGEEFEDENIFKEVERVILLRVVDSKWMDHIDAMDQLKQGIGLRAYGNEDPVRAYSNEGFDMFNDMNQSIREDTVKMLYSVHPANKVERKQVAKIERATGGSENQAPDEKPQPKKRKHKKIGPNDPCPCGSGKKYKKCHGSQTLKETDPCPCGSGKAFKDCHMDKYMVED